MYLFIHRFTRKIISILALAIMLVTDWIFISYGVKAWYNSAIMEAVLPVLLILTAGWSCVIYAENIHKN